MPDVLRGYSYSSQAARFRDTGTGKFVSRARITNLLESQVDRAEDRLSRIVQSLYAQEIAPGHAQTMMRDELRRLHLQNAALGKGGFDRLTLSDYGRVGRSLRDSYERMSGLLRDAQSGRVTLPQALNRIHGYVLEARQQFFATERESLRQSRRQYEERRLLNANESCSDCVDFARLGWQPAFTLPLPGERSRCNKYCRCTLERREVTEERQPARAERMAV